MKAAIKDLSEAVRTRQPAYRASMTERTSEFALPSTAGDESLFGRLLSLITDIHPKERVTALMLATNMFILLGTYYVLKTVREALILTEGGAEVKSYSAAGQ